MRSIQPSPKPAINLSLNAKAVEMAKEMGINISQKGDQLLTEEVLKLYWARWNQDNAEAVKAYNA